MKKLLLVPLIVLLFATPVFGEVLPRPTTSGFVFDTSNVIDDAVEQELNDFAYALQQSGQMEIFFITLPTIGDYEPFEYGVEIFRTWGIGDTDKDNGMLIYATTDMPPGENTVRITTGYGMEGAYPDGRTGELLDTYMIPALSEGDYTTAFAQVAEAIRQQEEIAYEWQQPETFALHDELDGFTIAILIGFVVAFFYYIYRFIVRIIRGIQGAYYRRHYERTGNDISSKGYKRYVEREEIRRMKRQAAAAAAASASYDSYSSGGGSSDSYSGGGGDSGGGGSDRNF